MIFTKRQLIDITCRIARAYNLDPSLVCAICDHESAGWNMFAVRFEPAFLTRYVKPVSMNTLTTKDIGRATSWGLMQIMGLTAEELGFKPIFPNYHAELCDPEMGVKYGCLKLQQCFDKVGADNISKALLCYNGGSNAQYPSLVTNKLAVYSEIASRSV